MIRQMLEHIIPGHHSLGIEITDSHIKMCEIRGSGRDAKIENVAAFELPSGTMNDGRIQSTTAIRLCLQKLLDEHRWSSKSVNLAMPSQLVMVRLLQLPDVSDKELKKIVDFEVKHNMHLPFDNPYYDYVRLGKSASGIVAEPAASPFALEAAAGSEGNVPPASSGPMCEVMLVLAPMDILQQYISIFEDVRLKLRSIEIKAFSLNRLEQQCMSFPEGDLKLLIDVNDTNCDLTVTQHGAIKLTRNLTASFSQSKTINQVADHLFADFSAAEPDYDSMFNDLANEIDRFMNFYRYTLNNRQHEFQHLVFSGDIPMMEPLVRYFEQRLTGIHVHLVQWTHAQMGNRIGANDIAYYAVPIGLGLRGKR